MSCYITALIAGPYDVVRDEVQTRGRHRAAGHLLPQVADRSTSTPTTSSTAPSAGFAFFENEFDQPYPFEKYDQLFMPEYNMGAMENAGAVTFTEVYVFRSKVTEAIIERRALTILHELAHMWFGDLVTMQLVERPVAQRVVRRVGLDDAPGRGHRVDRRPGRRSAPPRRPGPTARTSCPRPTRSSPTSATSRTSRSTSTASPTPRAPRCSSSSWPTSAASRSSPGCARYFAKHAWGNTTLPDLLAELEQTSGRDLSTWSKLWLETAGVNTLRPEVEVDDEGVITRRRRSPRPRPRATRRCARTASRSAVRPCRATSWCAPTGSSWTSTASAPRCPSWSAGPSRTCCWSTTTTWPTPRSASTSARWPPRWRTRAASPTACPARWSWARPGT